MPSKKSPVKKSSIDPAKFKKEELVTLGVKKLGLTEAALKKYTKPQIADLINSGGKKLPEKVTPQQKPVTAEQKPVTERQCQERYVKCKEKESVSPTKKASPMAGKKSPVKKSSSPKKTITKKSVLKVKMSPFPPRLKSPKPKVSLDPALNRLACIENSKMALKEHQIRVVEHMRSHKGLIVAHKVGSGKTLTAVTAAQCFLHDNPKGKIIVVTPVSLQKNFIKEMKGYGVDAEDAAKYEFYTFQGFASEYKKKVCGKDTFLIIDEAHEFRTVVKSAKAKAKEAVLRRQTGMGTPLRRADVSLGCASTAGKILLLTATPMYNDPSDLANLMAMIKGETEPLNGREFANMSNSPDDFRKYFSCAISFYEPKMTNDYPSLKEHYVEIEMTPQYYEDYKSVEDKKSHLYNIDNPWAFLTGVRLASNTLEGSPKCDWVVEKVKKAEKTLIYSAFLSHGIEIIQKALKAKGIKFSEVKGSMTADKRAEAVRQYNTDEVKILFITKAGGLGLDLKGTRVVVIFESSWNRANEEQVLGRAQRYKSHAHLPAAQRHIDAYHLLMVKPKSVITDKKLKALEKPSADTILKNMIDQKIKIINHFMKRLTPLCIEQLAACQSKKVTPTKKKSPPKKTSPASKTKAKK